MVPPPRGRRALGAPRGAAAACMRAVAAGSSASFNVGCVAPHEGTRCRWGRRGACACALGYPLAQRSPASGAAGGGGAAAAPSAAASRHSCGVVCLEDAQNTDSEAACPRSRRRNCRMQSRTAPQLPPPLVPCGGCCCGCDPPEGESLLRDLQVAERPAGLNRRLLHCCSRGSWAWPDRGRSCGVTQA